MNIFFPLGARDWRNFGHGWRRGWHQLRITSRQTCKILQNITFNFTHMKHYSKLCHHQLFLDTNTKNSSWQLTLLSIVSIGIAGHTRGKPSCQAGSLSLGALVFYVFPVPDDIVFPLQLSDHQEELVLRVCTVFLLIIVIIIIVFLPLKLGDELHTTSATQSVYFHRTASVVFIDVPLEKALKFLWVCPASEAHWTAFLLAWTHRWNSFRPLGRRACRTRAGLDHISILLLSAETLSLCPHHQKSVRT